MFTMRSDHLRPIDKQDAEYYQARAEQELELAQRATHPEAARAHSLIASHYLDLVHSSPFAPDRPAAPLWR